MSGNVILKTLFYLSLMLFVVACSSERDDDLNYHEYPSLNSPAARVSLLGKKLAAYDIQILESDTTMLLIIPTQGIFNPQSATFSAKAYAAFDLLIELLNYYEKSVVAVTGFANYSDDGQTDVHAKALAEGQAHKVAQYLWNQGINASFIYAESFDMANLRSDRVIKNSCVIINFRKN